jgi:hypothetical protein
VAILLLLLMMAAVSDPELVTVGLTGLGHYSLGGRISDCCVCNHGLGLC